MRPMIWRGAILVVVVIGAAAAIGVYILGRRPVFSNDVSGIFPIYRTSMPAAFDGATVYFDEQLNTILIILEKYDNVRLKCCVNYCSVVVSGAPPVCMSIDGGRLYILNDRGVYVSGPISSGVAARARRTMWDGLPDGDVLELLRISVGQNEIGGAIEEILRG